MDNEVVTPTKSLTKHYTALTLKVQADTCAIISSFKNITHLMNHFSKTAGRLSITLLFALLSTVAAAQSKMIKNIFKLLPPHLVYGITAATKDSMLKGKTYYPAENDNESIIAYNYGVSTFVKDYMFISMSYETSQRASGMVEIRAFDKEGKTVVIVSNSGGVEGVNYQQNDISAFIYDGGKKLVPYKAKLIPEWSVNLFLKPGVPDSIKKVILNNSNLTFNLSTSNISLSVNSSYLLNNQECRKWMKGDQIKYTWTGKEFRAGPVYFSDINL